MNEKELILTKRLSKDWCHAMEILKDFHKQDNIEYYIHYNKNNQTKEGEQHFEDVKYCEEAKTFIFDGSLMLKEYEVNKVEEFKTDEEESDDDEQLVFF